MSAGRITAGSHTAREQARHTDGRFGTQARREDPSVSLRPATTAAESQAESQAGPCTGARTRSAGEALESLRSNITSLEAQLAQLRGAYAEAPGSLTDPALRARGAATWDDAVHQAETGHRTALAAAAEIAEAHYREAGCKWAAYYRRDIIEAGMTGRQPARPIRKRSGPAAAATAAAVEKILADPAWVTAVERTETTGQELTGVLAERTESLRANTDNDQARQALLGQMETIKARLRADYAAVGPGEEALAAAEQLDAAGAPDDAAPVGLREPDVLRLYADGSTNLWARPGGGTWQRVTGAEAMTGPGRGIRLQLADGTEASSVAVEERQYGRRPRVRPGAVLELMAEPAGEGAQSASQVLGTPYVGGVDDLY